MRGTNLTDDDIDASDSYIQIQSPLSHRRALYSWDSRPEFAYSFCAHYGSKSGLL